MSRLGSFACPAPSPPGRPKTVGLFSRRSRRVCECECLPQSRDRVCLCACPRTDSCGPLLSNALHSTSNWVECNKLLFAVHTMQTCWDCKRQKGKGIGKDFKLVLPMSNPLHCLNLKSLCNTKHHESLPTWNRYISNGCTFTLPHWNIWIFYYIAWLWN